jgi:hypothetical protein
VFDFRSQSWVGNAQGVHSRLQAQGVERIDCKRAVAARRAAEPANQPRPGALGSIAQRGIHNLHQAGVSRRKIHAAQHSAVAHLTHGAMRHSSSRLSLDGLHNSVVDNHSMGKPIDLVQGTLETANWNRLSAAIDLIVAEA